MSVIPLNIGQLNLRVRERKPLTWIDGQVVGSVVTAFFPVLSLPTEQPLRGQVERNLRTKLEEYGRRIENPTIDDERGLDVKLDSFYKIGLLGELLTHGEVNVQTVRAEIRRTIGYLDENIYANAITSIQFHLNR